VTFRFVALAQNVHITDNVELQQYKGLHKR